MTAMRSLSLALALLGASAATAADVTFDAAGEVRLPGAAGLSVGLLGIADNFTVNYAPSITKVKPSENRDGWLAYHLTDKAGQMGFGRAKLSAADGGGVRLVHEFVALKDRELQLCTLRGRASGSGLAGRAWRASGGKAGTFPKERSGLHFFSEPAEWIEIDLPEVGWCRFQPDGVRLIQLLDHRTGTSGDFDLRFGNMADPKLKAGVTNRLALTITAPAPLGIVRQLLTVIRPSPGWMPVEYRKDIVEGSALDFSGMGFVDGPAGKYGWVKAVGDHFEFERRPGRPVRFYGVNLCFGANFPEKDEAEPLVTRLTRLGYNSVRVHHYDGQMTAGDPAHLALNAKEMDKFDFFFAKLAEAGFYVTTDLYCSRPVTWKDLGRDRAGSPDGYLYKGMVGWDDAAFANWKAFARNFLTHVNPYTGRRYADEPALAWISHVNEGNLYGSVWGHMSRLPEFKTLWRQWLKEKAAAGRTYPKNCVPGDPAKLQASGPYNAALTDFCCELEVRRAVRERKFLREELGVKALLTSLNCRPHRPAKVPVVSSCFDYVDDHFYVDHPKFLGARFQLPSWNPNTNPLFHDEFHLARCAFTRVAGKPFAVSEWNFAGPSSYRGMGGLLTGALAGLQDWNVLWRFAYAHSLAAMRGASADSGSFDLATDPLKQASDRAVQLLFLRGDIEKLPEAANLVMSERARQAPDKADAPVTAPSWRNRAVWGTRVSVATNAVADAANFDFADCGEAKAAPAGFPDVAGEVRVDWKTGDFAVATPRTAGGFSEKGQVDAGAVAFKVVSGAPATVWASSLDGEPIARSKRILAVHLTDMQKQGYAYVEPTRNTLVRQGAPGPVLAAVGRAEIRLRLARPQDYHVYVLATDGERIDEVATELRDGELVFTADVAGCGTARIYYEVACENLRAEERLLARYAAKLPKGVPVEFREDQAGTSPEAYSVVSRRGKVIISGATQRARLYGLGRLVREPDFRGESAPVMSVRGVYFAAHFGNWYDNASERELREYVEDLALWGCNQVRVWFDMHEFAGVDDPRVAAKVKRLKAILRAAAGCGLKISLLALANEAFANSPEALRADWRGGQNGYVKDLTGHYHVELCPSKPGGLERILDERAAVLNLFADLPLSQIAVFPYDQGGCTCAGCAPWGVNGLLKILPGFAELVEKRLPGCRLELSTWRFDEFGSLGEWQGIFARGEQLRAYVDSLSVERLDLITKGTPGMLPASSMSEISMRGMLPWGGFGANPQPRRLAAEVRRGQESLIGFRPYSEGIYEDLNKVVLLQLGWDPKRSAEAVVGDYAAFYFGAAVRAEVAEGVALLEENLNHAAVAVQDGRSYDPYSWDKLDWTRPYELRFAGRLPDAAKTARAEQLLVAADRRLPSAVRRSWRWRILLLRAKVDRLLSSGATFADAELAAAFAELNAIYRVNERTERFLAAPAGLPGTIRSQIGQP